MSHATPADDDTLAALVRTAAARSPREAALLAPGRTALHFAALDALVRQVGSALHDNGIGPDDTVAVVLPNGPEMATCVVAVAANATCAPLNPGYRADEFRFFLDDLRPRAMVLAALDRGPARAVAAQLGLPCLDLEWTPDAPAGLFTLVAAGARRAREARPEPGASHPEPVSDRASPPLSPDATALVLHTSGTTSRPKIVPLSHGNLVRSARNVAGALALTPRDRCLNVMPLFHIHGIVGALLASLAAGGGVVCTPGLVAGQFLAWLTAFRPTWYTAVPTLHQAILAELAAAPAGAARGILRLARSSSAALPPAVARDLEDAIGAPVIEAYGMTEAAHQIASNPLPPRPRKPGSVGLPAGPEIAIMDATGRILAPGQPGEIAIRGRNVMPGYRGNEQANRTAFVDGWFRTGDEGVLDADGYLSITGRLKEMINRGGEKIAPREVDEALLEHPAVSQAVAFAIAHPTLGEDLVAAVVLKPGALATGSELREHLFGRLVEHKIPSRVVIVDAIPKGPTGKVQRIGLAQRLADPLGTERVAPRTEAERTVSEIFAEVLGVDEVCANDNFFALGGDSLRGGQVLARLRARLGVSLLPTQLFRAPTVEELAKEIAAHEN